MGNHHTWISKLPKGLILVLVFILVLFRVSVSSGAVVTLSNEYEIKAAFIYNFGKFVEWPQSSWNASEASYFHICVIGNDPFKGDLISLEGKSIQGHEVKLSYLNSVDDIKKGQPCHVLFIGYREPDQVKGIAQALEPYPILTVADRDDALKLGVHINLRTLEDRVRFEINLKSALKSGLVINSKLLKLAVEVVE